MMMITRQFLFIRLTAISLINTVMLCGCPRVSSRQSVPADPAAVHAIATLSPPLLIPENLLRRGFESVQERIAPSRGHVIARPTRWLPKEERVARIHEILDRCGGLVTDTELVHTLAATQAGFKFKNTRTFWQWARNAGVAEDFLMNGVIRERLGNTDLDGERLLSHEARGTTRYDDAWHAARLRYALYRLMIVYQGFIKLTGQAADFHGGRTLSEDEEVMRGRVEEGLKQLPKRLGFIRHKYLVPAAGGLEKRDIYDRRALNRLEHALKMLEDNNIPATHTALIYAMEAMVQQLNALEQGSSRQRMRRKYARIREVVRGRKNGKAQTNDPSSRKPYRLYRRHVRNFSIGNDAAIPGKIYRDTGFSTRWQLMQAIDHMVDSELDEREEITALLALIRQAREDLNAPPAQRSDISLLRAAIREFSPRWLTDKMFVRYGVIVAIQMMEARERQVEEAERLAHYADRLLGLTRCLLESRLAQIDGIVNNLENGFLQDARQLIERQNQDILRKIGMITARDRGWAWQLATDKVIKNEPEFAGLAQTLSALAKAPAGSNDDDFYRYKDYMIRRVREAELMFSFMKTFRGAYVKARRSGQPADRYAIFQRVYADYIQKSAYTREWPHMRMRFYLAAMQVPLEIPVTYIGEDGVKKQDAKRNPVFSLINAAAYLQETQSFARGRLSLIPRRQGKTLPAFRKARALLDAYLRQGQPHVYQLGYEQRRDLVNAMAIDLGLLPGDRARGARRQQAALKFSSRDDGPADTDLLPGIEPELRVHLVQALEKFLRIKPGVHQEMPAEELAALKASVTEFISQPQEDPKTLSARLEQRFFPHTAAQPVHAGSMVADIRAVDSSVKAAAVVERILTVQAGRRAYQRRTSWQQGQGEFTLITNIFVMLHVALVLMGVVPITSPLGIVAAYIAFYQVGRTIGERMQISREQEFSLPPLLARMRPELAQEVDGFFGQARRVPVIAGFSAGIAGAGVMRALSGYPLSGLFMVAAGTLGFWGVMASGGLAGELMQETLRDARAAWVLQLRPRHGNRNENRSPERFHEQLKHTGMTEDWIVADFEQTLINEHVSRELAWVAVRGRSGAFAQARAFIAALLQYGWFRATGSMTAAFRIFDGLRREQVTRAADRLTLNEKALSIFRRIKQYRSVDFLDVVIVSRSMEELLDDFFARPDVQEQLAAEGIRVRAVIANPSHFVPDPVPGSTHLLMRGLDKGSTVIDLRSKILFIPENNIYIADRKERSLRGKRLLIEVEDADDAEHVESVLELHREVTDPLLLARLREEIRAARQEQKPLGFSQEKKQRLRGWLNRPENHEIFDALAKQLLAPENYNILLRVQMFYGGEGTFAELQEKAARTAEMLRAHGIEEAYPVGYPFYGEVDIQKRINLTVVRLLLGEIDERQFMRRIVPDLDMIVVSDDLARGPFSINEGGNLTASLQKQFSSFAAYRRHMFEAIDVRLREELSLQGMLSGDDRVSAFKEGELWLDTVFMPRHIWENMPAFVEDADVKIFTVIRDLLLSVQAESGDIKNVPQEFMHNYVLSRVSRAPEAAITEEELRKRIFERHPQQEIIGLFAEARLLVEEKTRRALVLAEKRGLITRQNKKLSLTEAGQAYLGKVLAWRSVLLIHGYDVDGDAIIDRLNAWLGKPEARRFSAGFYDESGQNIKELYPDSGRAVAFLIEYAL